MEKMKTFGLLSFAMMAAMCVSVSSCSKDNDDKGAPSIAMTDLEGSWNGTLQNNNDSAFVKLSLAAADSTGNFTTVAGDTTRTFKWSLADQKLVIAYNKAATDSVKLANDTITVNDKNSMSFTREGVITYTKQQ